MREVLRTAGVACALMLLGAGPARGQDWTLDLYGGRVAYDLASSTSGEEGVVLGVRYEGHPERRWLQVSAGLPFGSNDSRWAAGGLGTRLIHPAGPFELGVELGTQGYVYRDPVAESVGSGGIVDVRPLLALGDRDARLEARSGWVQYGSRFAGSGVSRGVHDSDLSLDLSLGPWARISGTVRHVRAGEDDYTFGAGRLTAGTGRLLAWSRVGAWTSDALPTTEWGVGASVELTEGGGTRLGFSVRQDASDPVYWSSPRRRWSVGVSHTLGSRERSRGVDDPAISAVTPEVSGGRVTIRIPVGDSGARPSIAGDFTDWKVVPMVRSGDQWTATFRVAPGVYHYAFRSPSGEWYVPEEVAGRQPDGMGGFVAVLVIP